MVTLESFIFRKHPCGLKAGDGGGTAFENDAFGDEVEGKKQG